MFRAGQYVIYKNGDTYEIGLVKHIVDDTCTFVWYHEGDTAAKTNFRDLHPIMNEHCIVHTSLGGATRDEKLQSSVLPVRKPSPDTT